MKGHIKQRGKGSFAIKVYIGRDPITGKERSKWHTIKTTSKRAAQNEAAKIIAAMSEGRYVETSNMTVKDWLSRWLTDHVAQKVSRATAERYKQIVEMHLIPALGSHKLAKLAPLHIQSYLAKALTDGRKDGKGGLSPMSVRHNLRVLSNALKQASKQRLIYANPCGDVDAPRVERNEMATLTPEQAGHCIAAAWRARHPLLGIVVTLALTTGMRRGEILGLRWKDVDLDGARLSVTQSLEQTAKTLAFKAPKTQKGRRTISLPSEAVDALRRHKAAQNTIRLQLGPSYEDNDLVCALWNGEPASPRAITKAFSVLAAKIKMPVRLHGLRHSHLSHLLALGVHPKIASERAGHANIAITMDTYSHVMPGLQEDAARQIDALLKRTRSKNDWGTHPVAIR